MKAYTTAQSEITAMRAKRDAGQKRREEINKRLDELTNTIGVSEAILRIKELTGVEVCVCVFSHLQLPASKITMTSVAIPLTSLGRICGKNQQNVVSLPSLDCSCATWSRVSR